MTKYQYWDGTAWVDNTPSAAKPILPAKTTSLLRLLQEHLVSQRQRDVGAVQPVPEQVRHAVRRLEQQDRDADGIDSPQGTWSEPTTLVSSTKLSGKYAPYIHPWSGTQNLSTAEQQYLYWNLSTWNDYQVRLMRTDLTKV